MGSSFKIFVEFARQRCFKRNVLKSSVRKLTVKLLLGVESLSCFYVNVPVGVRNNGVMCIRYEARSFWRSSPGSSAF